MMCVLCVFVFKQKTAYEMRISDWSSDVCSSDLSFPGVDKANRQVDQEDHHRGPSGQPDHPQRNGPWKQKGRLQIEDDEQDLDQIEPHVELTPRDRQSVV